MQSLHAIVASGLIATSLAVPAATLTVPFHDGSPGGDMQGEFVIDFDVPLYGVGPTGDYLYYQHANAGVIRFRVRGELNLELPIQVLVVAPKANGYERDSLEFQTFTSDLPNDWHMRMIFERNDGSWLGDSIAQPTDFSISFDEVWMEVWFTDEYTPVRGYYLSDVIIGQAAQPIPLPSAWVLLAGAVSLLRCRWQSARLSRSPEYGLPDRAVIL